MGHAENHGRLGRIVRRSTEPPHWAHGPRRRAHNKAMAQNDVPATDEELIALFYGCSADALGQLSDRYHRSLVVFFLRSGCENGDALDLTQQTFLRIMLTKTRGTGRFDSGKASFKTWMYRIAQHLAIDTLERSGRFVSAAADDDEGSPSLIDRIAARGPTPTEVFQMEGFTQATSECWEDLPSHYRMAFVLFYFKEVPIAEIGAGMGKTVTAVEMILHHARVRLRTCLKGKGFVFRPPVVRGPLEQVIIGFEDEVLVHFGTRREEEA
jgi:RNA polymerase sigma factor (sigma-70 family)